MATDKSLINKSISALKWNYFGAIARSFLQLLIGIILARILGPEPFGLIAIASLVIGLGNLLSDFGFGSALIQKKEILEQDLRFVFTYQIAIGLMLFIFGFFAAEYIANFFLRPDAVNILRVMFSIFFLQAIGQTSAAVLRRALDYKNEQRINIGSYFFGYVLIGLPAAFSGWGAWSLVAAQLSQTISNSLGLLYYAAIPMRLTFKTTSPRILSFGFKVVAANITSYLLSSLDSWMIGRVLGITNLGIYSQARILVASPVNIIITGMQKVLFASCSRIQKDNEKLTNAYIGATALTAFVCFPIFITVALVPDTIIYGIYGRKWAQAVPVIVPLALAMSIHALLAIVGPILMAVNKIKFEINAQIFTLLVMIPVIYISSRNSLALVGWGVLFVYCLRWVLLSYAILKELECSWLIMIKVLVWPIVISITTALPTFIMDQLLYKTLDTPKFLLVLSTAGVCLIISMRYFLRNFLLSPLGKLLLENISLPIFLKKYLLL